jgi:site-specific recombinase XerD
MVRNSTENTTMARDRRKPPSATLEQSWQDSLQEFTAFLQSMERSPHTIRNYRHDLIQFRLWYESADSNDRNLDTVSQANAVQFREWKASMEGKMAAATINRRLSSMHTFLEWAFNTRRIERQIERPKALRQKRLGHRGLEKRDERDLLDAVENGEERDRAVIHLLLYTGLRVDELARMKWSHVKVSGRQRGFLFQGKGSKTRYVPIISAAMKALEQLGYAEHRGTERRMIRGQRGPINCRAIQAICERYGINAHRLRHTFAHNFLKAGGGLEQLADIMGHEDIETTRRYVVPSTGDLHAAMERMGAEA